MAIKIMIDAGHGGYDNGASYGGRREKDEVLELALAVGEILQAQGYDVEYTRTTDVYDSPVQKARIGNASGADFFVSIHRNSSPTPNQYNGVQTLIYNESGIKKTMAENVNRRLEEVGYRNINVDIRPDLAVLRRTQMPAILVEAGFINSDIDNELWDTRFSETAEAIAQGIDETIKDAGLSGSVSSNTKLANNYYGYERNVPVFAEDSNYQREDIGGYDDRNGYDDENEYDNINDNDDYDFSDDMNNIMENKYQILVGIFRSFGSASYQMNRLINEGYMSEIYEDEGLYQVRVGAYENIEEALISQRELRDRGYETLIVKNDVDN